MKKTLFLTLLICAIMPVAGAKTRNGDLEPVRNYYRMLDSLRTGWNTWDTRSMFTQLYLPEAFSVKLALVDAKGEIGRAHV